MADFELIKNNQEHWEFIRLLRTDSRIQDSFIEQIKITEEDQVKYMQKYNDSYYVCILKDTSRPVGFIGVVDGDLRLAVSPEWQNNKVATFMLNELEKMPIPFKVKIKNDNEKSISFFKKHNFEICGKDGNLVFMNKQNNSTLPLDKLPLVIYTHFEYQDVLKVFIKQASKFFINNTVNYIFINKQINCTACQEYKQIYYNNNNSYARRMLECLEQIDSKFILFTHEDMYIYNKPEYDKISKAFTYMQNNNMDCIKLSRTTETTYVEIYQDFYQIDLANSKWIFSIQPTIWKVETLKTILSQHLEDSIWQMEENAQKTCFNLNIAASTLFVAGKKRGLHHFDNNIYPYIATAICKGKWNTAEYPELKEILKEHNINLSLRGIFKISKISILKAILSQLL